MLFRSRFSTVAGSRGSADTVRDVRGFAVRSTPRKATSTSSATTCRSSSSKTESSSPKPARRPAPTRRAPREHRVRAQPRRRRLPVRLDRRPGVFVHHPQRVNGVKERVQPTSFDDHHTQAALFWNSLTDTEQDHVVGAFTFELSKVQDTVIVDWVIANLANAVVELPARLPVNLGRLAPPSRNATSEASAALSMETGEPGPVDGRQVAKSPSSCTPAPTSPAARPSAPPSTPTAPSACPSLSTATPWTCSLRTDPRHECHS